MRHQAGKNQDPLDRIFYESYEKLPEELARRLEEIPTPISVKPALSAHRLSLLFDGILGLWILLTITLFRKPIIDLFTRIGGAFTTTYSDIHVSLDPSFVLLACITVCIMALWKMDTES